MKAYTDLEQSNVLKDILPIESADMHYSKHSIENYYSPIPIIGKYSEIHNEIPCWSLPSLMSLLPPYLFEFERGIDLQIGRNETGTTWNVCYMPNNILDREHDKFILVSVAENLIDAVFDMILKLHEQDLLDKN